jgi:cytidylate kinase
MVRVITVEREYGSAGVEIAQGLAERLGWELVDHALVRKVAQECNVESSLVESHDERCDPWYHRLSKAFWQGAPERTLAPSSSQGFDCEEMVEHVCKLIEEAADRGNCVIVGRGAACILSSRIDAFHIFVYGCRKEKLEYARKQICPETTLEKMEHVDRDRAAYIRRYFGLEWDNRKLYDLMINSAVGIEAVVNAVIDAAGVTPRIREMQSA